MRFADTAMPRFTYPLSLVATWLALGCQALAARNVEYYCEPMESPNGVYAESFARDSSTVERDWSTIAKQHCWSSENLGDGSLAVYDEDEELVLIPGKGRASWDEGDRVPLAFRTLNDDFVVFASVEAAQRRTPTCPEVEDSAGLVARDRATQDWATLLVRTAFAGEPASLDCIDDLMPPPRARAKPRNQGFDDGNDGEETSEIGDDGQVDIALCRTDHLLYYYYREVVPGDPASNPQAWQELHHHQVSTGPLDVGVTVSSSGTANVEGHFSWVVFQEGLPKDGCPGTFEDFVLPLEPAP